MGIKYKGVCRVQHGDVYGKEAWTNERPEGTHGHRLLELHWRAIWEYLSIKKLQQNQVKTPANWLCLSCGVNMLSWSSPSSLGLCWKVWWLWCCLGTHLSFLRPSVMVISPHCQDMLPGRHSLLVGRKVSLDIHIINICLRSTCLPSFHCYCGESRKS